MRISAISNVFNNTNFAGKRIVNNYNNREDVFIRMCNDKILEKKPEKKQTFESFNSWAEATNFTDRIDKLVTDRSNILGVGEEGTVYEIPNSDDFVIKQYKRASIIPLEADGAVITELKDIAPKMNIGQPIATVRTPVGKGYSNLYYIHKKQSGHEIGVARKDALKDGPANIRIHLDALKLLADAPQSTFDKCVEDTLAISKLGLHISGSNPQNYMFDKATNEIKFVDINDKKTGKDNQLSNVLYALLGGNFIDTFFDSTNVDPDQKADAYEYTKQIIKKFVEAMNLNGVELDEDSEYFRKLDNAILYDLNYTYIPD